jgi:MFS family permease
VTTMPRSVSSEALPLTPDASESPPERHARLTGQRVGTGFVWLYILATVALWIALLTPASVTLALRVADLDPAGKTGALSMITGVGALFALISNPVFGRLSDLSTSRWGQRKPYMIGGTLFGTASLLVIGLAPNTFIVGVGWCLTQICFNAALAALVAILPERIPAQRRGVVSGLMGMTIQTAQVAGTFLVLVTGTVGVGMFIVPALIAVIFMLAFSFFLKEVRKTRGELPRVSWWSLVSSMWVNPVRYSDFAWVWLGRFLLIAATSLLTTYKTYFLMDRLHYTSTQAAGILFWSMLILALTNAGGSVTCGWLSDLVHRRKVFVWGSSVVFGIGMLVVAMSHSLPLFFLGVAIAGLGGGMYTGVDYALVADVLPNSGTEAGKDMGVLNLANALPQSVAPAIAPIFLAIGGGGNYTALYLGAAGFSVAGAVVVRFIRGAR